MKQIKTKRAYDAPEKGDGRRVLVDRLWPRGVSRDRLDIDVWLKDLAPSDALRKWFAHDPDKWNEFKQRYALELDAKRDQMQELTALVQEGPVTLIYAARDSEHNNAAALRDYVLRRTK